MSVAVIVLDTLRYDTFCEYFDWLPGKHFSQSYSTSHWTIPAHASLLTGFYPSELGVIAKAESLDCEAATLPEMLKADGYMTRLFSANVNLVMRKGWDRGFDQSIGMMELDPEFGNTLNWRTFIDNLGEGRSRYERYLRAVWECIKSDFATIPSLRQGVRMVRKGTDHQRIETICKRIRHTDFGDKEFLFVNAMDMHTPYNPPESYRSVSEAKNVTIGDAFADTVTEPNAIRRAYKDAAAYLSDVYREMFSELMAEFEYVITLSDHGEMLGENGMWNHGYGLYPELVHVPLVISGGDIEPGTNDAVVNLLDVHRTVADVMGVETPSRGRNLLNDLTSHDVLFEYHGFLDSHESMFDSMGLPGTMYDRLDTPLDGFVTTDRDYAYQTHDDGFVTADGVSVDNPEAYLDSLRENITRRQTTTDDTNVLSATMEHLEDLGYA